MGDMMSGHNDAERELVRAARVFYLAAQARVADDLEYRKNMDPAADEAERLDGFIRALTRHARTEMLMGVEEAMDQNPQLALPLLDLLVEILRRNAPDELLRACVADVPEGADEILQRHRAHNLAAMFTP